ncbi:mammalian cell entry protein [Sphingomonas oleivorans]|uniref:Mammalian cell entry protein n=1 Tax=Sphingomonas oleivorans TaxID=1735121 RepID=A0A2T5FXI6_9SPHN|nr:MlaD family protein [Sphingomonas oleivorans]PTQ10831.1 mammalian cell entry protein [Sphingomonas oleivorans]
MENRSNHVLVGGVVLALLVIALAFIVWLAGFHGTDDKQYDIFFKTSVEGLSKGSSVTFAGVPVGKVDEIALMPEKPEFVRVRISVKKDTPILQGTTATIAGVGFTGVSQINLEGAVRGAPPITQPGEHGVPTIPTKPGALGELLNSAPELLERLSTLTERLADTVSPQNQRSITGILTNLDRLSGSLADRGPEIAATLAETRIAVRQAGIAAEQIGKLAATTNGVLDADVRPVLTNLNRTVISAQRSMETLDAAINDARPGLQAFSARTAPELGQLVRDLSEMSEALTAVAGRFDRGGAGAVLGGSKLPDYEPKK